MYTEKCSRRNAHGEARDVEKMFHMHRLRDRLCQDCGDPHPHLASALVPGMRPWN